MTKLSIIRGVTYLISSQILQVNASSFIGTESFYGTDDEHGEQRLIPLPNMKDYTLKPGKSRDSLPYYKLKKNETELDMEIEEEKNPSPSQG